MEAACARRLLIVISAIGVLGAFAQAAAEAAPLPAPVDCQGAPCWDPAPTTEPWQWQLQGRIDLTIEAPVYDIDYQVEAAEVDAIHAQGDRAICYVSVGTYEPFRPDAKQLPKRLLGKRFEGFEEERWLDIRRPAKLRPIIAARFDTCAAKGFDAVEPDNVEAYSNKSGFPISAFDQLVWNVWVANAVHKRGMAVGLKNDLGQIDELLPYFDFQVNEQCFQYNECGVLERFIDAGKPVFGAEYEIPLAEFCKASIASGFSTISKRYSLKAPRKTCRQP